MAIWKNDPKYCVDTFKHAWITDYGFFFVNESTFSTVKAVSTIFYTLLDNCAFHWQIWSTLELFFRCWPEFVTDFIHDHLTYFRKKRNTRTKYFLIKHDKCFKLYSFIVKSPIRYFWRYFIALETLGIAEKPDFIFTTL